MGNTTEKPPRAEHLCRRAGSLKCLSTSGRAGATETFGVHREGEDTATMLRCWLEPPETQPFPKLPTDVLAWDGAGRDEMGWDAVGRAALALVCHQGTRQRQPGAACPNQAPISGGWCPPRTLIQGWRCWARRRVERRGLGRAWEPLRKRACQKMQSHCTKRAPLPLPSRGGGSGASHPG